MRKERRQRILFTLFIVVGIGFNLTHLFGRELYRILFLLAPLLLLLLGGTFLAFMVWAVVRKRHERHWLIALFVFALITPLILFYDPEWLRAKTVFRAQLVDDLSLLDLRIRKDGTCTTDAFGMMGFSWVFHGKCELNGQRVIFHDPPYDSDLFPPVAPIIENKLILRFKDEQPDTSFAAYFEITYWPDKNSR